MAVATVEEKLSVPLDSSVFSLNDRRGFVVVLKAGPRPGRVEGESSQIDEETLNGLIGIGLIVAPPLEPDHLLTIAEQNVVHGACLQVKTTDSVGHGWKLSPLPGREADEDQVAEATRMLEQGIKAITPEFTFAEMLEQARWECDAIGWAAWEIVREESRKIAAMYPLPAANLRSVIRQSSDDVLEVNNRKQWAQIVGSEVRHFVEMGSGLLVDRMTGRDITEAEVANGAKPANEIILFRRYSHASRRYGVPSWIPCIASVTELAAIREYNLSFYESGGLADMLLHATAGNIEEAKKIAEAIMANLKDSRGNAHVVLVTYGTSDTAVNEIQIGNAVGGQKDGDFAARREELVKEVLIAHQVPPYRVGWAEIGSLGGNAAREMLRAYRFGAIEPWQELFESRLGKTLFGKDGIDLTKLGMRWELIDLDWEQMEIDLQVAVEGCRIGMITPNEGRQKIGYAEKEDPALDKHYVNGVEMGTQAGGPAFFSSGGSSRPPGPDLSNLSPEEQEVEKASSARLQKVSATRDAWLKSARGDLKKMLDAERHDVVSAAKKGRGIDGMKQSVEDAIALRATVWKDWLRKTYLSVADDIAVGVLEELADSEAPVQKAAKKKPPVNGKPEPEKPTVEMLRRRVVEFLGGESKARKTIDLWRKNVEGWLRSESGEKITGNILQTTKDQIRKKLADGLAAGEGVDDIAKRLDKLYLDEIIPHRSEVIARTEVISASNLGSTAAANSMAETVGIKLKKRWIATRDDRTRESHAKAHGQEVGMDQPFELDEGQVMFPGDSSLNAPGEEVIQCRCTLAYRRDKE